jgi:hypothetical protein
MEVAMLTRVSAFVVIVSLALVLLACGNKPATPASETTPGQGSTTATTAQPGGAPPAPAATLGVKPATLPAGSVITVRLDQAVGSKISKSGEIFNATVAEPVEAEGRVVIPKGAIAEGTVAEAVPRGRFKGGARLRLTLNSVNVNGRRYPVQASLSRATKGKGKRTAGIIGGGAGVGALIGGLAGGGKGAAIGAAAGAGAGTAGAALTGNKDIVLPAETALAFRLAQPVQIK